MTKALIINAYYYPGWRSGGPQQTIMNVVDVCGADNQLHILTHHHDMGDPTPYPDIPYDEWTAVGNAQVYYSSREKFSLKFLREMADSFDLVYLCGPYCDYALKILLLNRMNRIKAKIVLASMGSFSKGALAQKQLKKKIFWTGFRWLGLYKNITWSFTSEAEKAEAAACIAERCVQHYYIAEDLPRRYVDLSHQLSLQKAPGSLKIVFLSRICPMKNLTQAIQIVSKLQGTVQFHIYGTTEDTEYWKQCQANLAQMPSNITWRYCGAVPAAHVIDTLLAYDIFLLPTMGENFGHAIYEALMAGCIPFLSDRTLWKDLQAAECGYATSLDDTPLYVQRVQQYVDMDEAALKQQKLNAMKYAQKKYTESVQSSGYWEIFK